MTKYVKIRDPELIIADLDAFLVGRINYLESKINTLERENQCIDNSLSSIPSKRKSKEEKEKELKKQIQYRLNESDIKEYQHQIGAYKSILVRVRDNLGFAHKLLYEEIEEGE